MQALFFMFLEHMGLSQTHCEIKARQKRSILIRNQLRGVNPATRWSNAKLPADPHVNSRTRRGLSPKLSGLIRKWEWAFNASKPIRVETTQSSAAILMAPKTGTSLCLSLIFGLPVFRSWDASESARLMIFAGNQLRRHDRGSLVWKGTRPKGKRRIQLQILQGLPSIGPERAEQLLDRFGSVEAVMAAQSKALLEVAGIGEKTAAMIRWAVGSEPVADVLQNIDYCI
jgi:hypothetical protein